MTRPGLIQRLLPSRPLSTVVFVVWLLLVGSLAPAQILLAAVLAVLLPLIGERLRPQRARLRRPAVALRLLGTVAWDIVVSNIEVARLILGPQARIQPGWIWIPLDLRNEHGIAALGGIITMTPGTLTVDLTPDRSHLLVHCLNLRDPAAAIAQIKARYEAPLKEIFP
jgi:multicomponent K+:H+ antiporter subunit E